MAAAHHVHVRPGVWSDVCDMMVCGVVSCRVVQGVVYGVEYDMMVCVVSSSAGTVLKTWVTSKFKAAFKALRSGVSGGWRVVVCLQ